VSERGLKRLAMHAVKTFEKEVKEGKREALAEDEIDDGKDEDEAGKEKKRRVPGERKTGVKQAKLVRQADRIDPITNKGRSKGYGFLEMDKHEDSLRVLRWANNNPEVGPLLATWWKDELHDLVWTGIVTSVASVLISSSRLALGKIY
jgi:nucleolar protein 4